MKEAASLAIRRAAHMRPMDTRFDRLEVVTSAVWLADDLAANTLIPVRHSLGLDAPDPSDRSALWCSGAWAGRVAATGIRHPFLAPGPAWLAGLPQEFLGRKLRSGMLGGLLDRPFRKPLFVKLAEHKSQTFDARVHADVESLRAHAAAAFEGRDRQLVRELAVIVSQPVEFVQEFRAFIAEGQVTTVSHYLTREGGTEQTWQSHGRHDGPFTGDAWRFAQNVCDAKGIDQAPGYTLDVGRLADGRWAVVEANAAWSSNPYHADPDGAVASILSSQRECEVWRWRPDTLFAASARALLVPARV